MPTAQGIHVHIGSQFGGNRLPEFAPDDKNGLPDLSEKNGACTAYVPFLAGSQFWINYSIDKPHYPPFGYFYFSLYVNGASITSWGVGKEDGFAGSTSFTIHDCSPGFAGVMIPEKRGFFFASSVGGPPGVSSAPHSRVIDIRVHRAKARRRVPKQTSMYKDTVHGRKAPDGIEMKFMGKMPLKSLEYYYQWLLTDTVDKPLVMFRFYHRTWEELDQLGLTRPDLRGISRIKAPRKVKSKDRVENEEPRAITSKGDEAREQVVEDEDLEDDTFGFTDSSTKRLSIPPTTRLYPTKTRYSKPATEEKDTREAWLHRTPSPVKVEFREMPSPPPVRKRSHFKAIMKSSSTGMLREVEESARSLRRSKSVEKMISIDEQTEDAHE